MNKNTKIYLVTNCYGDHNKIYIGKTKNCRKSRHKKVFGKCIDYIYIDEINSLDKEDWKPIECFWIEYFRFLGFEVLNKNEGGGGPQFQTEESNLKRSIAKKGIPLINRIGKKHTEETKKSMSKLRSIKIVELDYETLNLIKIWDSITEVGIYKNINHSPISECCRGNQQTCFGSRWMYYDDYINNPKKYFDYWFKEYIVKLNFHDFSLIKIYNNSTIPSKEHNVSPTCLLDCCRGKQKSSKGYRWMKYSDFIINPNKFNELWK